MAYRRAEEAASSSGHPPLKRTGGRESNKMKEKVREGQGVRGNKKKENERHGGKKGKRQKMCLGWLMILKMKGMLLH